MKANRLIFLQEIIRKMGSILLHEIAACPIVFDYEDKIIIATAKGEIERRNKNGRR